MKIISPSTITALTIILLGHGIASPTETIVDDIRIKTENGTINCDSLICPPGAIACHVSKRNDPQDYSQLVRTRKCYAVNGAVTGQDTIYEPNTYQGNVNINVVSGGGSPNIVRPLTPEEQKELEDTLRRTQEQVQSQLVHLHEALRPLQDGSFSANLRNSIAENVQNSLRNAFNYS